MATMKVDENPFPKLLLVIDGTDDTPDADTAALYVAADKTLHLVDDDGTDTDLFAGTGVAEILSIPTAETDDTLVLAPDGAGGVEFRAEAAGGGGLSQAYVGYNTVGGSWETPGVNAKVYAKQVTLAADGLIGSIDAYIRVGSTTYGKPPSAAIYTDVTGAPGLVIAAGNMDPGILYGSVAGRWYSVPMGVWLTAGTYWIVIRSSDNGGAALIDVAYDGSGTDRTATGVDGAHKDWASYSPTTGTVKYSIRASVLS